MGRTARAGRGGRAITLMSEHDVELLHAIEARVGVRMEAYSNIDVSVGEVAPVLMPCRLVCAVGAIVSRTCMYMREELCLKEYFAGDSPCQISL